MSMAAGAKVELLLGGLRPGTKDPMPSAQREQILHHWRTVQRMTGQPFKFEGAMPEGFIYDTEPASRGVVTVSIINPEGIFSFFKTVQSAFYVEQQDVTSCRCAVTASNGGGIRCAAFSGGVRIRYREAPDP